MYREKQGSTELRLTQLVERQPYQRPRPNWENEEADKRPGSERTQQLKYCTQRFRIAFAMTAFDTMAKRRLHQMADEIEHSVIMRAEWKERQIKDGFILCVSKAVFKTKKKLQKYQGQKLLLNSLASSGWNHRVYLELKAWLRVGHNTSNRHKLILGVYCVVFEAVVTLYKRSLVRVWWTRADIYYGWFEHENC